MFKLGGLGVILMIFFGFWIMMASDPYSRFERACAPVDWLGNVSTSFVALSFGDDGKGTADWFAKASYGCQWSIWRLFYEDEWQEHQDAADGSYVVESPR